jgi:hypothetical protein
VPSGSVFGDVLADDRVAPDEPARKRGGRLAPMALVGHRRIDVHQALIPSLEGSLERPNVHLPLMTSPERPDSG